MRTPLPLSPYTNTSIFIFSTRGSFIHLSRFINPASPVIRSSFPVVFRSRIMEQQQVEPTVEEPDQEEEEAVVEEPGQEEEIQQTVEEPEKGEGEQVVPQVIPQGRRIGRFLVSEEQGQAVIPRLVPHGRRIGRFTVTEEHNQAVPQELQVSKEDWGKLFKQGKFKKEEMDSLVMDFLINHELADVAEAFHTESGCESIDLQQLRSQKIIRELISSHQIDDAINLINETFGSSFLGDRPRVHFRLEQQKMIELCRSRNFEAALTFSRQFIRWESFKAEKDDFRKECRRTLLLMVFGDDAESPVAELMVTARRLNLWRTVLEEIVVFHGRALYSELPYRVYIPYPGRILRSSYIDRALKMLKYKESKLREKVNFPHFNLNTSYPEHFPPSAGIRYPF